MHSSNTIASNKADDIQEAKKRTVLVILDEPEEEWLKKLEKEAENLSNYKNLIENYNKRIKYAVENYWPYKKEFVYKTKSEAEKILYGETPNSDYVFVRHHITSPLCSNKMTGMLRISSIEICLSENVRKYLPYKGLREIYLSYCDPSVADIKYVFQRMERYFDFVLKSKAKETDKKLSKSTIKKNALKLKTKTLLVDYALISPIMKKSVIKDLYPYPYRIVSREEIDNFILQGDTNYIYIRMIAREGSSDRPHAYAAGSGAGLPQSETIFYSYYEKLLIQTCDGQELGESWLERETKYPKGRKNFYLEESDFIKFVKWVKNAEKQK